MNRLAGRSAARWRRRHDEDGFTLAELIVTMAILSIVMRLVTGAVLQASATSARVDAAGGSQQGAHQAFDRLDRQVRWAAGFSTAGTVGGDSYVEWLYTAAGTATCYELRLSSSTRLLQQRSWKQGSTSTVTPWQVLASSVTPVDAATPVFRTSPAGSTFGLARLRIAVTAIAGGVKARDTATHDVTYTALNSSGAAPPSTVCTEGRSIR